MYIEQTTRDRIKNLCKSKKINMEYMLLQCELGVNAIRQINDTKGMASFSLAKIADYLDCSVDYLLGRTDEPSINTRHNSFNTQYDIAAYGGINNKDTQPPIEEDSTDF